jgi:hypothetical protein
MERGSDRFDLAVELKALRPEPEARFTAYLDTRVAADFPRSWALGDLVDRVRFVPPRRALATAGTCAAAALAISTAMLLGSEGGAKESVHPRVAFEGSHLATHGPRALAHGPGSSAAGTANGTVGPSSSSATEEAGATSSLPKPLTGPYASQARRRYIERSARIVIGADPGRVRDDSAKVFDAVHAAHGIVLDSAIREGEAGEAGAVFELLIPSAKLGEALADLSRIGEVRSRHESTADITAPTVGVGERLQDVQAKIENLLAQLAAASGEGERVSVEAQLRTERARGAALRSRLNALQRRTSFSRASVRIETGEQGSTGESGAGWGIGDGLRVAGRVLTVAAGVIVVGLAGLIPLTLALLLATLAYRAWLRRARERALP